MSSVYFKQCLDDHYLHISLHASPNYFLKRVSQNWSWKKEYTYFKAWNIDFKLPTQRFYQFMFLPEYSFPYPCQHRILFLYSLPSHWHIFNYISLIICKVYFFSYICHHLNFFCWELCVHDPSRDGVLTVVFSKYTVRPEQTSQASRGPCALLKQFWL